MLQWSAHHGLEQQNSVASMPSIGSTSYPESPYQRSKAGDSPVHQHMGNRSGHTSGQMGQAPQPKVGRMPSGNASAFAPGQMPSPFVPASTSQPIVGGAAAPQFFAPPPQGNKVQAEVRQIVPILVVSIEAACVSASIQDPRNGCK